MKRWQVAAALSAAVTATKPIGDRPHSQAGPTKKKSRTLNASRSSGEGVWGGGASLREAASSPESPSQNKKYQMKRWQVAAALSAAVTATKPIGDRPHAQAEPTKKKSRTPNASRSSGEGVWGGGASLREAASSPESPFKNKNPLPSMQNGSGTMAAYRRDGNYFRDAPSASQAASASVSGSSWQITLSQANTMPAARQLSSQVRIHSPSPQP